ncbi:MAG: LuxR C-terminal-related transcriptional regulator, partial [Actinomycetota bacterium]|nr:LuxR C-terminal-related transcriptional regulator [Actinomycetota bacterium]
MTTAAPARLARPAGLAPAPRPAPAVAAFTKYLVPEVVFGWGSLSEAGWAARRLGVQRPFVVTDAGLVKAGWWAELAGHLACAVSSPPRPPPPASSWSRPSSTSSWCSRRSSAAPAATCSRTSTPSRWWPRSGRCAVGRAPSTRHSATMVVRSLAAPAPSPATALGSDLTAREREVLTLLARGLSNEAIGRELYISATTAKFHVGNVMRKLA